MHSALAIKYMLLGVRENTATYIEELLKMTKDWGIRMVSKQVSTYILKDKDSASSDLLGKVLFAVWMKCSLNLVSNNILLALMQFV